MLDMGHEPVGYVVVEEELDGIFVAVSQGVVADEVVMGSHYSLRAVTAVESSAPAILSVNRITHDVLIWGDRCRP